jgi:hypothetical protein
VQQGNRPASLEGKIQLSHPDDRTEVEADQIAEAIQSMSVNQNLLPLTLRNQLQVTPVAPGIGTGVVVQRQNENEKKKKKKKAGEDWNFTPADYATLIEKKGKLKIADDSSWFPKELQDNLLNTLNALLDPARKPSATEGVNVNDFYHGHVAVAKKGTPILPTRITDKRETYYTEKGRSQNKSQETVNKLAGELLSAMVKKKGIAVIYHTFERNDPSDLAGKHLESGDRRRNYKTPLDTNEPDQYSPPKKDDAGSWQQDFHNVMQFSFLIDNKGEVHVRAGDPKR